MTMNPTSKDLEAKKENDPSNFSKFPSSSRHWSNNKNPRIVRVSRTFGGKDRHSKVRTVKGLRDRRIRLSVPTAVQLYDLQDKLGLGQPSKVVDWLLEATKDDIDKLPPLPMNFTQFQESSPNFSPHQYSLGLINPQIERDQEKNKWSSTNAQNQEGFGGFVAQNLFPISNYQSSSFPNMPYNSNYFHWDPQNLSLSQFGGGYSFSSQTDQDQQQSSNFSGSNSQLYYCPSSSNIPSIVPPFPSFITPYAANIDMRSQVVGQLQLQNSVAPTTLHLIDSPENDNGRRDKGKRHS